MKINDTELKVLLIQYPQEPNFFFADHFKVSVEAIRKRRKKLEAIVQYPTQEVVKVVETTKDKLEGDIEELRRIAFDELSKAMTQNDRRAVLDWFDRVTGNAKLRADISRSLSLLVDNRTQTQNIVQVTETAAPTIIRLLREFEGRVFSFDQFIREFEIAMK
jgi:hypothetical protein